MRFYPCEYLRRVTPARPPCRSYRSQYPILAGDDVDLHAQPWRVCHGADQDIWEVNGEIVPCWAHRFSSVDCFERLVESETMTAPQADTVIWNHRDGARRGAQMFSAGAFIATSVVFLPYACLRVFHHTS